MKLYNLDISGNCYRVRLLLALLAVKHELVLVDLMKGEHRKPSFLKLNPRGQLPVLDDDGTIVWDSMAILVYLARKYGNERWLPLDAESMAEVMQWLGVMENETLYGLSKARLVGKFKFPGNLEEAQALGRKGLEVLEQRLAARRAGASGRGVRSLPAPAGDRRAGVQAGWPPPRDHDA